MNFTDFTAAIAALENRKEEISRQVREEKKLIARAQERVRNLNREWLAHDSAADYLRGQSRPALEVVA